ncbi:MAG: Type IV pilus assembly protein PilB [Candidatus Berkelbacteria bacterium Licking1014_96]|uniref:Type IV pilus assembly protein PilB n=1 Tax=Candidatus Berkelbacteria bacterium Licking1014_96 TaxID=2017149 RepID=A0A554LHA7_9BACT|nr:MAG: Type IV pilus assembly protein PilB [Candidatus Berkelbacteria bacterium Licking1014_96]
MPRSRRKGHEQDVEKLVRELESASGVGTQDIGEAGLDKNPIIKITKVVLQGALERRASEIHIEPMTKGVRVRCRIDGILHEIFSMPRYVHAPLASRIKVMAEMNMAERRIPQTGQIHVRFGDTDFTLDVSTIPTTLGEKFAISVSAKKDALIGLDNLGMEPAQLQALRDLAQSRSGLIVVCGPRDSGRTSTTYSLLAELNTVERQIVTIEDLVACGLPGVNQVHVNRLAGLGYLAALDAFSMQGADVIMLDLIDGPNTANAVLGAAQDRLVIAGMNSESTVESLINLVEMRVDPWLMASGIRGIISQRLARRICDKCKQDDDPPLEVLTALGIGEEIINKPDGGKIAYFHRGVGCDSCRQTGCSGQIGLFELSGMSPDLRARIGTEVDLNDAAKEAIAGPNLRQDAAAKVFSGIISAEEAVRAVS